MRLMMFLKLILCLITVKLARQPLFQGCTLSFPIILTVNHPGWMIRMILHVLH